MAKKMSQWTWSKQITQSEEKTKKNIEEKLMEPQGHVGHYVTV